MNFRSESLEVALTLEAGSSTAETKRIGANWQQKKREALCNVLESIFQQSALV
jgi:hypothetical protein